MLQFSKGPLLNYSCVKGLYVYNKHNNTHATCKGYIQGALCVLEWRHRKTVRDFMSFHARSSSSNVNERSFCDIFSAFIIFRTVMLL